MRSAAIVVLVVSLVLSWTAAGKSPDRTKKRWNAAQVLVKYKSGFAPENGKGGVKRAQKLFGKFKLKGAAQQHAAARGLDRIYLLDLDRDEVESTIAQLSKDPNVEYAEPNWRIEFPAVPNDPSFVTQWGLTKIGAPAAWDHATSGSGVVIGVVDTGIDLTHPDLAANLWTNPGEIAGNNVDDDGNGFIDDVHGWDFWSNDNDPTDTNGHGTRVAGVIGAVGNNAAGVSGVAWSAKLAALRMGVEFGDVATAVQAVEYANMMGFRITNNSWGWFEGGQSFLFDDVVNAANAAGYLFIAAAGNDAVDNDWTPTYPSHYDTPNVIAVTATTPSDTLASYANWGARRVDLGAPGDNIESTVRGGSYGSASGTSLAAPFVAGAAALYWTANPSATHVQVRDEIFNTTDPLPALNGKSVTGGRLSIGNLFDPEASAPAAIGDLTITDTTFRSIVVRFTATGDDGSTGTAAHYDVRVSTAPITAANFATATQLAGEPIPQAAGTLETFKLTGLASSTSYYVAVRAVDNAGNAGAISNVATFTTGRAAVLFDDNVEGGPRAWTTEGTDGNGGPSLWHIEQPYGHSYVWSYSKTNAYGYDTGAANWGALITPEFDLAEARDTRLRFSQMLWTEREFLAEKGMVQVSVDGGAWTLLLSKMSSDYVYADESIDLSAYDGHRVRIRFYFNTGDASFNNFPGWQLDDLVLEATSTNAPPVANLNGPYSATEDQALTLSSTGSSDPEGAALEYKWSFGDGTFAYTASASVSHTWTHPGNYTVTLTAYDGRNASDPVTTTISPAPVNDRPVAVIDMGFTTPPYLEETPIRVTWFGSSDEENSPLTCRFDYGDGTVFTTACEGSWTHAWNRPGTYTITLVVNDGQLDSLPATQLITIQEATNDRPVANAGGPYNAHPNDPVTLDGTGSSDEETSIASYLWTFPDGTTSTSANPVKTFTPGVKTPSLVVTDQTGLTSTAATAQVRVCGGADVVLFGGLGYTCPGGSYDVGVNVRSGILPLTLTWSDGYVQTVTSLSNGYYAKRVVAPTQLTVYSLASVTDFLGCSGTVGTATTTVDLASVTLNSSTMTSCAGTTVYVSPTYKGSGPWTITWSDGYVQTVNGGDTRRPVSPSQTTNYSIVSATCASCPAGTSPIVSSGTVTVRIIAPPVATLSGGGVSCSGSSVPLNVTITGGEAPYTTHWSDFVSSGTNGSFTRSVAPGTPTTYSLTGIQSGFCNGTFSGSATVTQGTRPAATVSGGGAFCPGAESVTISAALTGPGPYTIVWSDGFTQTVSETSVTRQVSPSTATTYTITSITNGSCSGTSTGSATATPRTLPAAVVSGGGTSCNAAPVTITATVTGTLPITVRWSDGVEQTVSSGTTATRSVSPSTTTTYTLTSVANSCTGTSSGSATVVATTPPTATVSGGGTSCVASTVPITATFTGTGPFSIVWSDGVTDLVYQNSVTRHVSPSTPTTYTITSISTAGGCVGTSTGSATAMSSTTPSATVSGGGTSCNGAPVSITATVTGTLPITVRWSDGVEQTVSSGTTATRSVSPSTTTTYTLTSVANSCTGTSSGSATVVATTPPTATVSGGGTSCVASTVPINAAFTGTGPFSIVWSDGLTDTVYENSVTRHVSPSTPTTYTITSISTAGGCAGTSTGSATAMSGTRPSVTVSGGGTFCAGTPGPTITATITGAAGPFTLVWSDGFTQTVSTTTVTRQATASGAYSVTSISANGCTGNSQGTASVYRVAPTAVISGGGEFCPNGGTAHIHADLDGPAPFTLVWSDGFTETISSNSSNRYVSPATATTYTLTSITSAYGCSGTSSGSATATPKQAPTATVSGGGNSCSGSLVTISAALTGVAPFTVQWSDGVTQTINSGNTATRQVAPSQTTTYTVFMVAAPCVGTSSGSATVTVVPKPTATVSGGGTFCEGATATVTASLTGVAPFTVTWSDGVVQNIPSGTSASRAVGPTATTVYTVTALSDARCSNGTSSGSATATPTKKPVITQQPQSKPVAFNTSTSINVVTTETGLSYQWYQGPSGTTTTPVGTNSASFTTPKLKSTTQYWVKIWKTGCASYPTNSATATLTVP